MGIFISRGNSDGSTVDFLLSAKCDAAAAERFLAKAWGRQNQPVPHLKNVLEQEPPRDQTTGQRSTRVSISDCFAELGAPSPQAEGSTGKLERLLDKSVVRRFETLFWLDVE